MSPHPAHLTPYRDVNAVLEALLTGVRTVLGDEFVGLYVHGSLARGNFESGRSDIDFLVVTADEVPEPVVAALQAMHRRLVNSGSPWAARLEGSYIPREALRRYDPRRARHPHLSLGGHLDVEDHGSDWVIQRYLIREAALVLAGPDPRTLIEPLQPDDLRQAAGATLREWWAPMLADPARLQNSEYQAFAVLTMCRALYTLEHGSVASKEAAARWALEQLGQRWATLIHEALAWRHGTEMDRLDETIGLIRYTLEHSRHGQSRGK